MRRTLFTSLSFLALVACSAQRARERESSGAPLEQGAAPAEAAQPTPTTPAAPQLSATQPPAAAQRPAWAEHHALASNANSYRLFIDPAPQSMPDNESFTIHVWPALSAHPEALAGGLELAVDAAMPEHGHGMNRVPRISRADDGHFVVEGMYFHMTGHWELYFDITLGAVTERAQCDVLLAD
ncbi:MAG: hypothetical protein IT454_07640 [Planctomycetes bacterium]|nr:hypothetical protein [Planctomycetota bacterium]